MNRTTVEGPPASAAAVSNASAVSSTTPHVNETTESGPSTGEVQVQRTGGPVNTNGEKSIGLTEDDEEAMSSGESASAYEEGLRETNMEVDITAQLASAGRNQFHKISRNIDRPSTNRKVDHYIIWWCLSVRTNVHTYVTYKEPW